MGRIDQAYLIQKQLKAQYDKIDFNLVPELDLEKRGRMLDLTQLVEQKYLQMMEF